MAFYDHFCSACEKEFELEYGMTVDPPTVCVLCGVEGKTKRLISYAAPGKVELSGRDWRDKIKSDAKALAKETIHNENLRASLIGKGYTGNR